MILRLKPGSNGFAPSGMAYADPRTGAKFDGYEQSISGAVRQLIAHRQKNPKIYPPSEIQHFDVSSVTQEFYRHLHAQRPEMFVVAASIQMNTAQAGNPDSCFQCGATEFIEELCPTCGGRKVISKKCKVCGAKIW